MRFIGEWILKNYENIFVKIQAYRVSKNGEKNGENCPWVSVGVPKWESVCP